MEEVIYNSLKSYYNLLSNTGYVGYYRVPKFIILVLISRLIHSEFINEQDCIIIERLLSKLCGSDPLIQYPETEIELLFMREHSNIINVIHDFSKYTDKVNENTERLNALDSTAEELAELAGKVRGLEGTKVVKTNANGLEVDDIQL